jgi:hypothetical protein
MSRHTSNGSEGNDGSWFLEAIGSKPKPASSSEAVAELTAENTLPDTPAVARIQVDPASSPIPASLAIGVTTFDGDPGTSTSSFHPVPQVPPPPDLEHPIPDGEPPTVELEPVETRALPRAPAADQANVDAELSSALRSRRNFRWPIVTVLIVLIATVAVAAWWIPQSAHDQALAMRQSYYDAAADVRNYLPDAQGALDAVTNPASTGDAVAGAVPVIAELDGVAFALEAATAEPLPRTFPILAGGAVDGLIPLRDTGAILGASSSDLTRRLGQAYVYRTSIPLLLDTGQLPTSAATQEVNQISVRLAGSLASDAGIVSGLPDDPTFSATREAAVAALDRYASWQDEYLAALTGEDSDAAGALVDEIEVLRVDLNETNGADLLAFRTETDLWIIRLAGELETYMSELTQG